MRLAGKKATEILLMTAWEALRLQWSAVDGVYVETVFPRPPRGVSLQRSDDIGQFDLNFKAHFTKIMIILLQFGSKF